MIRGPHSLMVRDVHVVVDRHEPRRYAERIPIGQDSHDRTRRLAVQETREQSDVASSRLDGLQPLLVLAGDVGALVPRRRLRFTIEGQKIAKRIFGLLQRVPVSLAAGSYTYVFQHLK